MELENFIQFIKSFEPNDWVVMVSAIISAGSAFYLGYKNKKFEEKWKQKQIDADLVAKSRIQWIQEARKHTADLISLYYKILNEDNQNEIYKLISLAREKNELLILYFGPEKGENQYIKENDKDILMNEFNNKGKNVYIINFLERLFYDFLKYYALFKKIIAVTCLFCKYSITIFIISFFKRYWHWCCQYRYIPK